MVKKNLILLGMMAVGKTTLGRIVAKKLKLKFIDTDVCIEKKNSMPIVDIFEKKGEIFFREEEEKEVLKSLKHKNCIIAIGGGAFINKNIRENILKNAISIWLKVDPSVLDKRVKRNFKRPLLKVKNNRAKLRELYEKRKSVYELANHKINCDGFTKENIVKKITSIYEKY